MAFFCGSSAESVGKNGPAMSLNSGFALAALAGRSRRLRPPAGSAIG
jgi:hypothetical protein